MALSTNLEHPLNRMLDFTELALSLIQVFKEI